MIALTPTLPRCAGEMLLVPTMSEQIMIGTMIIFKSLTKRSPKGVKIATHVVSPTGIFLGSNIPIAEPNTKAIMMRQSKLELK